MLLGYSSLLLGRADEAEPLFEALVERGRRELADWLAGAQVRETHGYDPIEFPIMGFPNSTESAGPDAFDQAEIGDGFAARGVNGK